MTYAEMDLFRQSLTTRGGETGRLIAERDWSASPLGPIEAWPQALRAALGLILPSPVPMVLLWGNDGIRLYNDAYSVFAGGRHPALLGSKVREGWPEVADFNQNVLTVGLSGQTLVCRDQELTLFRHGKLEQVFMNLDNSPVLGEDGRPAGVLSVVVETTERVRAERQQSFLVMLGDALSDLSDPGAATSAAAGLLGRHLGVGRAGYGDIDDAGQVVSVARDWSEGDMISLAGEARILDAFGPAVITELRGGRTLVVEDCRTDPRTADPRFLATWDSIGTRALIVAPLLSAGRLVALLYVHSDTPRHWTGAEVSLVEDAGARTWATVQRARAESILRENEERLRLAAQAAQIGTWDHDLASGKGHWDDAALRIAGLPPDHSCYDGSSWTKIVHPDDRDRVNAAFQASLEPGGPPYEVEFRCSTPSEDGGPRWLTSLGTVFRDPATGLPVRAIGIMRDATNRRRDQERLAENESQLRLGLAAGRMVAWTYDLLNGEINRSENAEEIFGPGTTPTSFIERMPADDVATDQARLAAAIAGEVDRYESEFRYRHPDGRDLWLSNHGHVVRDRDGKPLRLHGVCIDITARKMAELALQQSEEQFKTLADRVPNFVWFAAPSGELRYLNQRWYDYTGQTPDQALPDGWATTLHPDDAAVTAARWSAALAHGTSYEVEVRYQRHDGAYRWHVARAEPLRDQGGAISLWFGTSTDIHDRRLAEDALRDLNDTLEKRVAEALAERKLLADVFENTDAMMVVADPDLKLLAFNRPYAEEVERLGGRRPRIGDRIPDLYADHPELAAPVLTNWNRAVSGEVFSLNEEHGDPGRYRRAYERRFEPLRDREGRLVGAYQFATDVTERLRDQRRAEEAEAARREADALYRAYFQNSGEALFVVGVLPDGGFTFEEVNPAHRAALGYDIASEPGRRIEEVVPPDLAEAVAANYRRVLETGELQRYRESAELGGRVMHVETVLVPVRDESGRIVRIVGSGRDMTAQVQAEEALRQSQKMEAIGQLTGGVAHDFNNLLTPIVAVLDRLQRQSLGGEREQRLIGGAAQSAQRAKTLVQRLLAFARRQPLQTTTVDVSALVHGMADLVASTIGPQIRVVVEAPDSLPPIKADPNQLEMALLNLAVNARDAMPDGGTLRITATEEAGRKRNGLDLKGGPFIRLSVADSGVGMDEATVARAVEPFFSTKGVGRGTGLGLSMVHGLASQLGGALAIQSRPGLGTNVELWLPQSSGDLPEAPRPNKAAEQPSPAAGTVLLVDDDELVRQSTAALLSELGYAVLEAASAEEAEDVLAQENGIDLLVTDHLMPGLTGTDLARRVLASRPDLPVLVISGFAESEGLEPALPRLNKPFRKDELATSLAGLARSHRSGQA